MSELLPLARVAYQAQQAALRVSLVLAHAGLRPFVRRKRVQPSQRDLRHLRRRLRELLERDFQNVEAGEYPAELLFQMPVREYAGTLPRLAAELPRMAWRARRGAVRELPKDLDLSAYPDYFRRNFHWQTDGYLSQRSAELYDLGVEFLFLGTADVMRRQIIPPLSRLGREQPGKKRVLDVGCGTGRALLQLSIAHPGNEYAGIDLSPFYVQRANELLAGRGVDLRTGNAEQLPFADASFDVVTSVFLFHELPRRARQNALGEMRRVLAPSGLLVLEDAAQLNDSPELETFLQNFGRDMNEPFFADYLEHPLERQLEQAGFEVVQVAPAFLSKVVVARAR
ncbi:MAG TPA: class I SAM-dependent methyltransferase [Polyangiaceae bacterium]|jgi:ubiquinone/menaquinone biosynthesis C-methylase UbiE|nr:class I SAM-dependent methyltransferase [Polyangiaceae bacterium]